MKMAGYTCLCLRFLLSVWIFFPGCDSAVTCRNDKNKPVDWYILYKFPNTYERGLKYLYMDGSTNGWTLSTRIISGYGSLANTLQPLLDFYVKKTEHFGYMLYNDQPPGKGSAPSSFGHSKGVVMLDKQTGVWLSHSTPRFPASQSKDFWPSSGNVNAQTFLCVTYPYDRFKQIGVQLKYIHAYSFDSDIPTTFHNELRCVAQRDCYPKKEPWSSIMPLNSVSGRSFLSVAKYTRFGDDLYSGLISNIAKKNLYVKSWGKLHESLPSNCSIPYHVYNVKDVNLLHVEYVSDTVDHSKWCVAVDGHGAFTCIADMNRETSQTGRGGGAICTDDPVVQRSFYGLIKTYEPCRPPDSDAQHTEL
uniref:Deoxyribonuclease-2-alpha n=1 Tax=Stegastes partitus TaxID=144197 RepID=A0A3B4ZKA9_9TELE